jgi:positive regulator of sigma E activity
MNDQSNRANIIAAFVIMLGAGLLFYFMPTIMLWIGDFSPALAGVFAVLAVLAFFAVFWLRSRYQKR